MTYDSRPDTLNHINRVRGRIYDVIEELEHRADRHDLSKLEEPEKSAIDRVRPRLKELDYGTPEYDVLKREFSQYHYNDPRNGHHIERPGGLSAMSLIDLIEMMCDWRAAVETHKDGDNIRDSIEIQTRKHNIDPLLKQILINTLEEMGW